MRWTGWSWLAIVGGIVVVAIAWVLFAPDLRAVGH